jgi:hypothetical protein
MNPTENSLKFLEAVAAFRVANGDFPASQQKLYVRLWRALMNGDVLLLCQLLQDFRLRPLQAFLLLDAFATDIDIFTGRKARYTPSHNAGWWLSLQFDGPEVKNGDQYCWTRYALRVPVDPLAVPEFCSTHVGDCAIQRVHHLFKEDVAVKLPWLGTQLAERLSIEISVRDDAWPGHSPYSQWLAVEGQQAETRARLNRYRAARRTDQYLRRFLADWF